MIAGTYARLSVEEGERDPDAKSVTRQVQRAKEYATEKGWRFDDRFAYKDDGVSGSKLPEQRPGLQKLLAALKHKPQPFQVLIVSEDSRLGRFEDEREFSTLTLRINKAGVKIYGYLDDEEIGRGMKTMFKSVSASEERRRTSQRTRDGMLLAHEQGKPTGGKLFGYKQVPTGRIFEVRGRRKVETKRVIDRAQAKIILLIFELRAKRWGHLTIANYLNGEEVNINGRTMKRAKIPSPRASSGTKKKDESGTWIKMKSSGDWSASQVGGLLKNEHYAGRVTWDGKTRVVEDLRIIPAKLWIEVQRINEEAAEKTLRRPNGQLLSRATGKHWITQYVRCGICDGSMYVRWEKGTHSGKGYLFCSRRQNAGKRTCQNARRLPVIQAERAIVEKFQEAMSTAAVIAKVEEWIKLRREAKELVQVDRRALQEQRDVLDREIQKLVDSLASVGATAEIKRGIEDRKARLEHVDGQLKAADVLATFDVRLLRDAVEAVTLSWRHELKRNQHVAGQVLGKLLPGARMKVTPGPDPSDPWTFEAEHVGYTEILREADQETAEMIEALARELEFRPEMIRDLLKKLKPPAGDPKTGSRRPWSP